VASEGSGAKHSVGCLSDFLSWKSFVCGNLDVISFPRHEEHMKNI